MAFSKGVLLVCCHPHGHWRGRWQFLRHNWSRMPSFLMLLTTLWEICSFWGNLKQTGAHQGELDLTLSPLKRTRRMPLPLLLIQDQKHLAALYLSATDEHENLLWMNIRDGLSSEKTWNIFMCFLFWISSSFMKDVTKAITLWNDLKLSMKVWKKTSFDQAAIKRGTLCLHYHTNSTQRLFSLI